MAIDYGTDVSTYPDLDPLFQIISGKQVLAEALLRRYQTPRGGLWYDPDYGLDIRLWLNESFDTDSASLDRLAASIEAEAMKDERVGAASVAVELNLATSYLTITARVQPRDAVAFELVLGVSRLTVELLRIN